MHQLQQAQNMHRFLNLTSLDMDLFACTNHCHAGGLATRIKLALDRLQDAGFKLAISDSNDKGHEPMHTRPASRQQLSRPLFGAWHQSPAFTIQHKNRHLKLLKTKNKIMLSFQQSTLTGLVTHTLRRVSLRECQ